LWLSLAVKAVMSRFVKDVWTGSLLLEYSILDYWLYPRVLSIVDF